MSEKRCAECKYGPTWGHARECIFCKWSPGMRTEDNYEPRNSPAPG